MATAVPTEFTNRVNYTEEVAEFSPEVMAEIDAHIANYPPITSAFVTAQKTGILESSRF